MKFIADAMLGRLARWLRLLGFDTLYYKDISDADLLKIAKQQSRIVLTRDTHFRHFRNFNDYLLIRSNETIGQLREIMNAFGVKEFNPGRCTRCNGILQEIAKGEEVKGLVPEHTYIKFKTFLRCQDCGNLYWEGTHIKRFREKVCKKLKDITC